MEEENKKNKIVNSITAYIIYAVIGAILLTVALIFRKPWDYENVNQKMQMFSDCFVIPGVLLMCMYALQLINRAGGFDGIGYSMSFVIGKFLPTRMLQKDNSYYAYKERRKEKRKPLHIEGAIIGALFLLIGFILFILYLAL